MTQELSYLSNARACQLIDSGDISARALTEHHLARAHRAQSTINCFTEIFDDQALAAAAAVDRARQQGKIDRSAQPLAGVPLILKSEVRWKGSRNESASLVYRGVIDTKTDIHAERLLAAGAVPIAKTTTPEFCTLGSTHSKLHGVTRNPWNLEMTPGGSSGGTGASLAAGVGILGTGSDIGGSIRIPAACSGIVGYKPPHGRVPTIDSSTYDHYCHLGPMTRSVADIIAMMAVMGGPHHQDQHGYPLNFSYNKLLENVAGNLKGVKIAYSLDLGYFQLSEDVKRETLAMLARCRDLGATTTEVAMDFFPPEMMFYSWGRVLLLGGAPLLDLLATRRQDLCDYTIEQVELLKGLGPHDIVRAHEIAMTMAAGFGDMMQSHDIFICPTNAIAAARADSYPRRVPEMVDGRERMGLETDWCMTIPFNMLYSCPVLAVPSGFADDGVPCGVQLVGKFFDEQTVLKIGLALEAAGGWPTDKSWPTL